MIVSQGDGWRQLDAIIFVHWGESYFLQYALDWAKAANLHTRVILVGDEKNRPTGDIEYYPISSFETSSGELRSAYVHLSSNDEDYEFKCFERWFIIRHLCLELKLKEIFYADSDVLMFRSLTEARERIGEFDFSLSHRCCGHSSYWNIEAISAFCSFIIKKYCDEEGQLRETFANYTMSGAPGGISDMLFLSNFGVTAGLKVFETTDIIERTTFDHNANMGKNGAAVFVMRGKAKELFWQDGLPYGKLESSDELIGFVSLHFQGFAKTQIPLFCQGRPQIYK